MTPSPLFDNWRTLRAALPARTLLLFRLGDFYEAFEGDAVRLAKTCTLALTKRAGTPMAGLPVHSSRRLYIPQLIAAGITVAIAEPSEDLPPASNFSPRSIVEIIKAPRIIRDR